MPLSPPAPSRRSLIRASGGALVLLTPLAGCGTTPRPDVTGSTDPGGDETVLEAARTEVATALAAVGATRRRHRRLREPLAGLERTHREHLAVLDPQAEAAAGPLPQVPATVEDALLALRRDEERLQRRLLTWAVAVDSGPLARLLASCSAGIAQQVATTLARSSA